MKKKSSSDMDEKDDKGDKRKPLFSNRLFAFIIDLLIVAVISSLISIPFLDYKKVNSSYEELTGIMSDYMNNQIDVKEYTAEVNNISYDLSRNTGILTLVTIFVSLLYYVVYQLHKNGQTIGKKIMKIRVISDSGELSSNQLLFRSFLANSILLRILDFLFIVFASKAIYFECIGLSQEIQSFITFVSIFLVMFTKEGLAIHDRLVHTKVVRI